MTPAKRRKLFRSILILIVIMVAGVAGRLLFLGQTLPSLLLARRMGSAPAGTQLAHPIPVANSSSSSSSKAISAALKDEKPMKIQFDVLGGWTYVEGKTPIPESVKQLDGKRLEIAGFMLPINQTEKITRFVLIQSLWGCCFGQTPAVNHVIVVTMAPGKAVEFYSDPVRVIGRFSVGETREEGSLVSIYSLEADTVLVK